MDALGAPKEPSDFIKVMEFPWASMRADVYQRCDGMSHRKHILSKIKTIAKIMIL